MDGARDVEHHRFFTAGTMPVDSNFNISYPLGDWLFGTLHRGSR